MDATDSIWWDGVMEMLIHSWSQTRDILAFNFYRPLLKEHQCNAYFTVILRLCFRFVEH